MLNLFAVENIDEVIDRVKNASPESRYQVMNEFKTNLSKMNKEARAVIIQKFKREMRKNLENMNQTKSKNQEIFNSMRDSSDAILYRFRWCG